MCFISTTFWGSLSKKTMFWSRRISLIPVECKWHMRHTKAHHLSSWSISATRFGYLKQQQLLCSFPWQWSPGSDTSLPPCIPWKELHAQSSLKDPNMLSKWMNEAYYSNLVSCHVQSQPLTKGVLPPYGGWRWGEPSQWGCERPVL